MWFTFLYHKFSSWAIFASCPSGFFICGGGGGYCCANFCSVCTLHLKAHNLLVFRPRGLKFCTWIIRTCGRKSMGLWLHASNSTMPSLPSFSTMSLAVLASKVCWINFEPPAESPWTNAVPAQLWLFLSKSHHGMILLTMLAQNRPKSIRQCFNRAICYFKIVNIKQGEATAICLRSRGKCLYWKQFCTEKKENLTLPLN